MKKIIILLVSVFVIFLIIITCKKDPCKYCKQVTYRTTNNVIYQETKPQQYCIAGDYEYLQNKPAEFFDLTDSITGDSISVYRKWICL